MRRRLSLSPSASPDGVPAEGVPVTAVVSRLVRPGREADYETWLHGITQVAVTFPGHRGVTILRPSDPACPEYVLVVHFDQYRSLKAWNDSTVRNEWLEKSKDLCEDDGRIHVLSGLENWFTLPGRPTVHPPPRWKMALVTWLAIYPMVTVMGFALNALLGEGFPAPIRSLIMSATLVTLMTWVVMPRLTRVFYRWLYA